MEDINSLLSVTVYYRSQLEVNAVKKDVSLDKLIKVYRSYNKSNTIYLVGEFIYRSKMTDQYLGSKNANRYGASWIYNGKVVTDLNEANEQEEHYYGV